MFSSGSTGQWTVIFLICGLGVVRGTMVRLVSTCTTNTGVGRCTIEPTSCQDLGGQIENEMRMDDGSKAANACAEDETCCMLSPAPTTDTCTVCGKKGTERQIRRSSLERHLESSTQLKNRLRVLRAVPVLDGDGDPLLMSRILNGDNAEKNEWCWQVALLNTDGTVLGSGSLINGRYILTAAHKVVGKNSSNLVVLIGQYDFSLPVNTDNSSTIWYAKPLEIIVHERYNSETLDNNVALIRIPMISCDAANVCPVCLNEISDQKEYMASLSNCYITGWGASIRRDASPILQEARVRILSGDECTQRFAALGLSDIQIPVSTFCAEGTRDGSLAASTGSNGPVSPVISTCTGDGGGPLVCEGTDGRWRLLGLIAMGLDDCRQTRISAPTVFVNVGMYVDWVKNTIMDRRVGTKSEGVGKTTAVPDGAANQIEEAKPGDKDGRKPKSVDGSLPTRTFVATTIAPKPHFHRVAESKAPSRSVFGRSG